VWRIKYTARSLDFIDDLQSLMLATLQVCLISFVSPFRTLSKLFFLSTAAIKTLTHPSDTIVQTLTSFMLVLNIAEMQFMLLIIYSNVSEEYSSFSYINDQRTNYFLSKRFLSVTRKTEKDRIRNVCFERTTKDRSCYSIADRGFRA
jgi:hypothetical protein